MSHLTFEHEHPWEPATMFTQQELERWFCLLCGQRLVRIVPESPLIEVDHWPSE